MNERDAEKLGLRHTGISSHDRSKVSEQVKSIRGLGYKCEVITQRPDGYSMGPYSNSNWYIAYADLEYEKDYWNHNSKISETWTHCDNDFLIKFQYIKGVPYYLIDRKYIFIGKEFAKAMNITPKIFIEQMKTQYNAIINEHGIALFKTKEDAKNALNWIESALVLNKII